MQEAVSAHHICKYYAGKPALNKLSFVVPENSICGLMGPNGAGKTSLLRILTRILYPDSGQIYLKNRVLNNISIAEIGYLPEERGLYRKMKAGEHLVYLARLRGLSGTEAKTRVAGWFRHFDIMDWWQQEIEALSKGMQQKLQFIAAIIHQPWFVILDEPFSGFDPVNLEKVREEILHLQQRGYTVLLATHRMDSVEQLCDYIVLMDRGSLILQGYKYDIINQYKNYHFRVKTRDPLSADSDYYEIISESASEDGLQLSELRIKQADTAGVLPAVLQQTAVYDYREVLPSVKDVFLQATGNK